MAYEGNCDTTDMIALWMFYAYTCRWQQTNQARATVSFASRGLKLSEDRVKKARNALKELGLISDVQARDAEGKLSGWYVRVRHLARPVKNHPLENPPTGYSPPKCSRTLNGNALGVAEAPKKEDSEHHKLISGFTELYRKRHGKDYPFGPRDGKAAKDLLSQFKTSTAALAFIRDCHQQPKKYPFDSVEALYDFSNSSARLLSALPKRVSSDDAAKEFRRKFGEPATREQIEAGQVELNALFDRLRMETEE